jgi:hypothetical protein
MSAECDLHFRLCGVHQEGTEAPAAWLSSHQEGGGDPGTAGGKPGSAPHTAL